MFVIPHPCFGVDGFSHAAEESEGREVVFLRPLVAPFHECTNSGGCRVENGHTEFLDDFPEAIRLRPIWGSLVKNAGGSIGKRAVYKVAVPGDPAHIGGAPVNILFFEVEDVFARGSRAGHVAASRVQNAFRLPGGSACVKDEQRMFAVERDGRTIRIDIFSLAMPPYIAAFFDMDIHRGALGNDDAFDLGVSLEGVVDILLEGDALTTAVACVCCHHNFRTAVS